jgi:monoterpene epsilon-lactone hydrolase
LASTSARQSGFQARPGAHRTRRAKYYCALVSAGAFCSVTARRLLKGPLHPGWDFRYELIATAMRMIQQRITRMPITKMRLHTLPTRVHISLRGRVEHERASFAGMYAEIFTPRDWTPAAPSVLYMHGGGYISCSPATHRDLVSRIAAESGARCISIDYRKAPEHPFPAPIDDCEAAYRALLAEGTPASRILLAGDSAGGGLVLAVLQRARAAGLPMPSAAILLSPWVDLSRQGASIRANAAYDYLTREALDLAVGHYLQGQDCMHPHVSPVHAELGGLPPLLLLTGSAELFLSENHAFAERALAQGVELTHHVEPGMVHVSALFASIAPVSRPAVALIGRYIRARAGVREDLARPVNLQVVRAV